MSYLCFLQAEDGSTPHFEALDAETPDQARRLAARILGRHASAVRAEVRSEDDNLIWELSRDAH